MRKYANKSAMFNPMLVECPFCKWACDRMVEASFCPNCYAEYEVGKRGGILFDNAPKQSRFPLAKAFHRAGGVDIGSVCESGDLTRARERSDDE